MEFTTSNKPKSDLTSIHFYIIHTNIHIGKPKRHGHAETCRSFDGRANLDCGYLSNVVTDKRKRSRV